MSLLKFVNVFFFQWFFIRLAKAVNEEKKIVSWSFIGIIVPCTGWWNEYIVLFPFHLSIWKR